MEKPTAKKTARVYSRLTKAAVWELWSSELLGLESSEVILGNLKVGEAKGIVRVQCDLRQGISS